jgi:nitroreductase
LGDAPPFGHTIGGGGVVSPAMDLHEALYTTRAMRRVKPDPIPLDIQAKILDAAVRAPSGGNQQNWRFLLLDDPDKKAALAPLYKNAIGQLWETIYKTQLDAARAAPDDPASQQFLRVQRSAQWLGDNFAQVPLFLFPFAQHDPSGGSIFPAVWSAMLAARAEGIGSCLTALLQYFYPTETFEILGVPADEGWILAATVSFGYPTGKWGVAERLPVDRVSYRNTWGGEVGFAVPTPLWVG